MFETQLDAVKRYASALTREEQYAWVAEAVGFILLIVGLVLLF